MNFMLDPGAVSAFIQVVLIDLVLAGDNAVVIGMAAAGLPSDLRRKAVIFGILAATVLRVVLAIAATQLLSLVGLLLAGGLLLLWVCWKMWQEIRDTAHQEAMALETLAETDHNMDGVVGKTNKVKSLKQAFYLILVADISMSLDNVLAVAGAARDHPAVLAFGLVLSIALMGLAASMIAKLLDRHRWIAYVGLAIIAFVAVRMVFHGAEEVFFAVNGASVEH